MEVRESGNKFPAIVHPEWTDDPAPNELVMVAQSSIIGDYPDAAARPGTSALWIGTDHHLNREEVAQLIRHLQSWVDTGSLKLPA